MPFTPSHMAAALPFVRTPLLPAALAIGTTSPDLFYFAPIGVARDLSHSWLGVFTVDLLIGVVCYLLWRVFLRAPVVDFTPRWARQRVAPARPMKGVAFAGLLVASVLIGAVTHVVWDSFTHPYNTVFDLPVLHTQLGPLQLTKWLQHASSIGGVLALAAFVLVWWRRTSPVDAPPTRLTTPLRVLGWALVLTSGLTAAAVHWFGHIAAGVAPLDPSLVFRTVCLGIAVAALVAVVIAALWYRRSVIESQ